MTTINSSTPAYINPTTREFPKRYSPLATVGVAPGFIYDGETGLVKPITTSRKSNWNR